MEHEADVLLVLALEDPAATLEQVGGKGASLARLAAADLPVPPGFHVTTSAYDRFVDAHGLAARILETLATVRHDDPASLEAASQQIDQWFAQAVMPEEVATAIRRAYGALGNGDAPVAVRSSATAEDLPALSFAGQHETYLNIHGEAMVLEAVKRCWASLWTARAIAYRARHAIASNEIRLAVVVQELVAADAAGILFTVDPMTGARDQMMINAAWGLGEAIVASRVTPDTLMVDKQTGAIVSQTIADKAVMTALQPEGVREEPTPDDKRRQQALTAAQAAELARLAGRIEQLYGQPMDVEWALQDGRVFLLQARPITALPEPQALVWTMPRSGGRYARSSVIELLPDPLSPMFATLALPLWNEAMRDLMQVIGLGAVFPDQLLVTINDFAFYDYGMSASLSVRMLLAVPPLLPRISRLLASAETRWTSTARPAYAHVVERWASLDMDTLPATQLLDGAHEIVRAAAQHYLAIQSGILPVAYMSEALFTLTYNRLAKRPSDPPALAFMLGFDSAPIRAEKSMYDLATWARAHAALADYLARATSQQISEAYGALSAPIADSECWREFCRRMAEHLGQFGHVIYDLDFAKRLPTDDPAPLLGALKYFLAGQGRSPYQRQAVSASARTRATQSLLGRLSGLRLPLFTLLLRTAQRYAPLREDALADVGLGWPALRRIFAAVGRRLVAVGAIAERDDVFWLQWNDVRASARALDAGHATDDYRPLVAERRARWERERMVTPPVTLPVKGGARFLGIDLSRLMPAHTDQAAGDTIRGIGASPGRVTGVARVLHGPEEFNRMQPGDILVAKITTPAWTPLFALASGVVTDVGGPLSHSSIVAREYHIPAVLGTGVATQRAGNGQQITVDGDNGVVTLGPSP